MKTKFINKLALAAVVVASLVCGTNALAIPVLDTTSPEYVGSIDPNTPSNPENEVAYIDAMRLLPVNGTTTVIAGNNQDNTILRSGNDFSSLPVPTLTGSVKDDTDPSNVVDITGFAYLLGKFGNDAHVWLVSGMTGEVEIPSARLSHWSLYNGTTVPDAGSTLVLLGSALSLLGIARRRA